MKMTMNRGLQETTERATEREKMLTNWVKGMEKIDARGNGERSGVNIERCGMK